MSSLQVRPRGGPTTWQLRVRHAGRDHYRHVRGTEADARAAGAAFLAELSAHGPPPASGATTLAAWADGWITRAAPGLAASTLTRYRELLALHILPRLGQRRLASLTAGDGLALQTAMLATVSPSTVWSALRLAKALTAEATRLRVIPADPLAAVRHVRQPDRSREVLPAERFARVIAKTQSDSAPAGTIAELIAELIPLALATGLRRGELLALRWADIEPDCAGLAVTGSLCPESGRKAPKTASGRRRVALPASAASMLHARRIRAAEGALAAGRPLDSLPVFPGPGGLAWADPNSVSRAVARALPSGVTLHGLRHAHATALLSAGVNPRAVQARLGHADIHTTLGVYAHALPRDDAAAIAILDAAMGGSQ